jgi:HSP20 family molecular chaperone IbpA
MNDFIERMRNAFRRTADRVTGRHVPVVTSAAPVEELENRRLRTAPVDIYENEHEVMIVADTPGAFPDNTKLHWDDRAGLSIYVQRGGEPGGTRLWGEALGEDWYRSCSLPDYVDAYEARAVVRGGVLTIQVPKQAQPAPVSIPVTAS